jgi:hypothetical protein
MQHRAVSTVFERITKSTDRAAHGKKPPHDLPLVRAAAASPQIQAVAATFPDLLEQRHEADYGPLAVPQKTDLLAAISRARKALADLDAAEGTAAHDALMALLLLRGTSR